MTIGQKTIYFSIGLGVAYWVIDSFIDSFIFHEGTFASSFLTTNPAELSVRTLTACVIIAFAVFTQITLSKQKKIEETLQGSENQIKRTIAEWSVTFDSMNDLISVHDKNFKIIRVNKAFANALKMKPEELIGKTCYEIIHKTKEPWPICPHKLVFEDKKPCTAEFFEPGWGAYFEVTASPIFDDKGEIISTVHIIKDITERKKREKELTERMHQAALGVDIGAALIKGDNLRSILQMCTEAIVRHLNAAFARIWTLNEKKNILELQASAGMYTHIDGGHSRVPVGKFKIGLIAEERKPHMTNSVIGDPRVGDQEWARREGMVAFAGYPLIVEDHLVGVVAMFSREPLAETAFQALGSIADEIAIGIEQRKAEATRDAAFIQIESEKAKWEATIAAIGDAITIQDRDFKIIYQNQVAIDYIGNHVGEYCYRAYEGMEQTCEGCPVAKSFEDGKVHITERTVLTNKGIRHFENTASAIRDSEGNIIAGIEIVRDITERKKSEEELKKSEASFKELTEVLGNALNEVKNREQILLKGRDAFLNMLEDITDSYKELVLAYDSTIEGWSKALDYRDKETEGHSQRVTEVTVNIARSLGMNEDELVHIRRGALLHDIGKLGVPDNILLKPGKLTEEEWLIMKKHTEIANELLFSIPFLRPAIDIPYCHHEKWDGTGYPRGLKGEEIPLGARIFAIVDVWDALRSDRPYRPAWSEEKTKDYIISLKGIQFDPAVVETFLRGIDKEKAV